MGHYSYCLWSDGVDGDIDGFFGIWEQASHDPHFELRRGGHCRCLPGDLTGGLDASFHRLLPSVTSSELDAMRAELEAMRQELAAMRAEQGVITPEN